MINKFTRPITSLEETEPNLIHRVAIADAMGQMKQIQEYHSEARFTVDNSHAICNFINRCDRPDYETLSEYLRVVIPYAENAGRITGMITEVYGRQAISQKLTNSSNDDIILTYTDYTSDEILKCIYHPWTYVDYRIPDGTWNTELGYSVWTLNVAALFKSYFVHRTTHTVKEYVYGIVLTGSIESIVQLSLINRVERTSNGEPYDVDKFDTRSDVFPVLEDLDKLYKYKIYSPTLATAVNTMPSIHPKGQFHTLHLPNVYQAEHITYLWLIARVPIIISIIRSSSKTLRRLEISDIHALVSLHRKYSRLNMKIVGAYHKKSLSDDINYLRKL